MSDVILWSAGAAFVASYGVSVVGAWLMRSKEDQFRMRLGRLLVWAGIILAFTAVWVFLLRYTHHF